jgi:hypothetical protein
MGNHERLALWSVVAVTALPIAASCTAPDRDYAAILRAQDGGAAGEAASGSGGEVATDGGATSGGASGGEGGAGTGGARAGGAGGAGGAQCNDEDGDGTTTCEGDCDDTRSDVRPGHAEICGDLVANDCDGDAEEGCMGLGTFVSGQLGDDDNPGTVDEPLQTIAQGIDNAAQIGGGVTVYVADAIYAEDLLVVETVNLAGGYQCDNTGCDWSRDAGACLTVLRPEDERGVVADETITSHTTIDGFAIEGKSGTAIGAGRAAFTVEGGSPNITNNCIVAPDVTGGTATTGRSLGLRILTPVNDEAGILVQGNRVDGGAAAVAWSNGVVIEEGTSSALTPVHLAQNVVRGGSGTVVFGVLSYTAGPGSVFSQNDISGGEATVLTFGVRLAGGEVIVDANRVNVDADHLVAGQSSDPNVWSGGVQVLDASATITNNFMYGANANASAALVLWHLASAGMSAEIVVNSNTLLGGFVAPAAPLNVSSGLALVRNCATTCTASLGLIRNNILASPGGNIRYPVWEANGTGFNVLQPYAFENNVLYLPTPGVASQNLYRESTSSTTAVVHATIDPVNAMVLPGGAGNNLDTDPKLNQTGHIGLGSLARDGGTSTDAPDHDFEGDVRPLGDGYDIGADESP